MIVYQTDVITVFQSAMFQLNTSVITTEDLVVVVDPGYLPGEVVNIRQFVDKVKGDRPLYLYFTHSDFDHIVGYGAFPDALTIASLEFVESKQKNNQLQDAVKYDDEFYLVRSYPLQYPEIDIVIKQNGQQLEVGNTTFSFYHGFGHNHDGLIAHLEGEDIIIAGDYLSDIEFPFVYYSFTAYNNTLATLEKLAEREKSTLVTSHGTVTNGEREINKRILDSKEYLSRLKIGMTDEEFFDFLKEKNYQFPSIFMKRHLDNMQMMQLEREND